MKLRAGVILELFRILWFLKIILHPGVILELLRILWFLKKIQYVVSVRHN
jgi:hypothetical protein